MKVKLVILAIILLIGSSKATVSGTSLVHTLDKTLTSILTPVHNFCEIQAKKDACFQGDLAALKLAKSTAIFSAFHGKPYAYGVDMLKNWLLTVPKKHELDHGCLRTTFTQLYSYYFDKYKRESSLVHPTCAVSHPAIQVASPQQASLTRLSSSLNTQSSLLKSLTIKGPSDHSYEQLLSAISSSGRQLSRVNAAICEHNVDLHEQAADVERAKLKQPRVFLRAYLKAHDYAGVKRVLLQIDAGKQALEQKIEMRNAVMQSEYCKHAGSDSVLSMVIVAKKEVLKKVGTGAQAKELQKEIQEDERKLKRLVVKTKQRWVKRHNKKINLKIKALEDQLDRSKDCQQKKDLRSEIRLLKSLKQKVPKMPKEKKPKIVKPKSAKKWIKKQKKVWKKKTWRKKVEKKIVKKITKKIVKKKQIHLKKEHHKEEKKQKKKDSKKRRKHGGLVIPKMPKIDTIKQPKTTCKDMSVDQAVSDLRNALRMHKKRVAHLLKEHDPVPCTCCEEKESVLESRLKLMRKRIRLALKKKRRRIDATRASLTMASLV